ncbi:5-formyltetrahydrofolate cyclo-ligase [Paracoccus aminovorans]|uniref:5-formyltetrahydrofolate cyclo-ligase n=1 Tax=Paracoccus aminovorans TaxID=34004 RepID=A0A1I2YZ47_9RHOB|nr:5-formyltetrahydrofolate cyclo-ligase [Paracoccus aminovorans]CQR85875.1 5-formyltetrahydrofolate cyclo-ligase [Paracoccus aminovorans]SFH30928.1 5-formyltetrahydrofolate cyclo-ligase [Paracoccus aminovorans]
MDTDLKSALRQQALAARAAGGDAAELTRRLIAALAPHRGKVLAGYWPMRDEADPRPAMEAHDGPVCLPVVTGPARPLLFRTADGRLEPGGFGTSHPPADSAELRPEVLIVPLAGFDRTGNRLGYGGGFYDRTLESLRAAGPVLAIGLAYAVQEIRAIPAEPTDQVLDMIVTDREVILPQAENRDA